VPFWDDIVAGWVDLPVFNRNTAVIQWWTNQPGPCVCNWNSPRIIGDYLRLRNGQLYLERIVAMFEEWLRDSGRPALHKMDVVWRRG